MEILDSNKKLKIEYIEIQFIHACNLSCKGCATFSELKHHGYTTWDTTIKELRPWLKRLDPECIGVMGGEPLMHPQIIDYIKGLRDILPDTQIRVPTNGLLLEKRFDVVQLMESVGNTVLKISYHLNDPKLKSNIKKILNRYDFSPVTEFGINRWRTKNNFVFQINAPTTFLKSFTGEYKDMKPHANNPADSFAICVAQRCPFLFQGKIFKCSTAGLTPWILERFGYPNKDLWKNYMNTGLDPDCTNEELKKFLDNFGKPHRICAQCPSSKDLGSLISHKNHVQRK